MHAYYADQFVLPLPEGHRFPMAKYRLLRDAVAAHLPGVALQVAPPASDGELALAHAPGYIDAIATGTLPAAAQREIGFPWSPAMAERARRSVGATIAACRVAMAAGEGGGIAGNLAGYPILDPVAALIVGFMVARMGWGFGWDALHDLVDRSVDEAEVQAIRQTLMDTPGVSNVHDVRTRKMGDMIIVDAHIEVDALITVEAGHDIAVEARQRVLQRHRVLNLMTHVDPWHRPDLDHPALETAPGGPTC